MFFKNLRVYRLTKPLELTAEQLAEKMSAGEFQPCGALDLNRYGWVPPLGSSGTSLVHATDGCIMVCAKKQEKILPGAVVNEHLDQRVAEIEKSEDRRIGRKERQELKDEIIFSLLPKAFTRSRLDLAYIDNKSGLIVVNSSSAKRAEDLLAALRQALESLPCLPLTVASSPAEILTEWVRRGHADSPFLLGENCELTSKDGRKINAKKEDLSSDEIRAHLNAGHKVKKVALGWKEAIIFTLDDEMSIKRLKFADALIEKAGDRNPETDTEKSDCEFAIMALEIRHFIADIVNALGGEVADAN